MEDRKSTNKRNEINTLGEFTDEDWGNTCRIREIEKKVDNKKEPSMDLQQLDDDEEAKDTESETDKLGRPVGELNRPICAHGTWDSRNWRVTKSN